MKLTDEQLMDILKEAVKAIAVKYNSIVAENEKALSGVRPVEDEVAPKEIPKKEEEVISVAPPKETPKEPVKEEVKDDNTDSNLNRELLEAMSYNELKVLAKEVGVKAIGSKIALIDKILEVQTTTVDPKTEMTTEEIEETTEVPQNEEEEVVEGYVAIPKEDGDYDEVEFEEEPIEDSEDEEEEESLYTKLVKETMDMSDEEIADLLADVGISPKGRRQALLSKLEGAVRDGLIAFGEDDEEEPTQETETEDFEQEEVEIAGSEERVAKVEELYDRYLVQYEGGEISDKDVKDFLKDYYNGSEEYTNMVATYSKGELAEHYALLHAQLVDDEGEEFDWGEPYIVEDEYWCSGKPMKMIDENTLYDEVTGEQFELE